MANIVEDDWLEHIESMAFHSELQKLADSPIYGEDHDENYYEGDEIPESEEGRGYVYHSLDGIKMDKQSKAKKRLNDIKEKVKGKK